MMPWLESFHRPTTVPEALRLVRNPKAKFVAGATHVLVQSDPSIKVLVDVARLKLDYIRRQGGGWVIGAATTLATLAHSQEMRRFADGILARAAAASGPGQVRNRATLGGELAYASPASEVISVLLALDAEVVTAGTKGRRRLPLSGFFRGFRQTALSGALLTEVFIPPSPRGPAAWSFQKLALLESDVSVANVAAGVGLDKQGKCLWARIALGGVAPTAVRVSSAEKMLEGKSLDGPLVDRVCRQAWPEIQPVDDVRATAAYRREMSGVLVRRALEECAARMGREL